MKKILFYKLQGAGNDFVGIDNRENLYTIEELKGITPGLCDRKFGIGADGLVALFPSDTYDYCMLYLNADGSDAGMCGNGGRCISRLAHYFGFSAEHTFEVHGRPYNSVVTAEGVTLEMPAKPVIKTIEDDQYHKIFVLNTGNEHICVTVPEETLNNEAFLRSEGRRLRGDTRFQPEGTNVNFFAAVSANKIKLVTYERGVEDLTLACGTGAVASAICHSKGSNTTDEIEIECPGGVLFSSFSYSNETQTFYNLKLKGPAEIVYKGEIHI